MRRFRVDQRGAATGHVLIVLGDLDLETVPHLACDLHTLRNAGQVRVVLDLSGLRTCDAAAMAVLVRISRQCAARGGWLRLAAPTGLVATVFAIVPFGRDVPVYATVEAALLGDDRQRVKD